MVLLDFQARRVAADAAPEPRPPLPPDVLAAARAGARGAFAILVRRYQGLVFGVALRICGQRADAEEIAQDAFLQLHGQLDAIADELHLRHWLIRTVSHRAIDRLRQRERRPSGTALALEALSAPLLESDPLLSGALARLLESLAGPARAVLVLRFQEDLDPTEIATILDMPVNTVKSHLRRSLEWLRMAAPELDHGS